MSTANNVIVQDKNSEEKLFECLVQDIELAYKYAAEMEGMGIEVDIIAPTVTDTLCHSLGIDNDRKSEFDQSVVAEIDDHDGSCCHGPNTES